jgi:hypothetical protein
MERLANVGSLVLIVVSYASVSSCAGQAPVCGNGVTEAPTEQCDLGAMNGPTSTCSSICRIQTPSNVALQCCTSLVNNQLGTCQQLCNGQPAGTPTSMCTPSTSTACNIGLPGTGGVGGTGTGGTTTGVGGCCASLANPQNVGLCSNTAICPGGITPPTPGAACTLTSTEACTGGTTTGGGTGVPQQCCEVMGSSGQLPLVGPCVTICPGRVCMELQGLCI